MRTAFAMLLVARLAFAADDAPLAEPDAKGRVMDLHAGEIVPFDAQCIDGQELVRRTRREADVTATLAKAETGVLLPKAAVVGIILGALALGAAGGAAVVVATQRR